MDELNEATTTRHDDKGRFCNLDSARTVVKDGVRHLVIGKYDRKTGQVKRHPRKRPKTKTEAAFDQVQRGRDRVAKLVDTRRPAVPVRDIVEARDFTEIEMDDEALIQAAKEAAKADSKNRFGEMGIRRHLAKKHGVEYVKLRAKGGGKYRIQKEIQRLGSGKDRVFVPDRARGYWKIAKQAKGRGVEFKKMDSDTHEILINGEFVGEIVRQRGLKPGATRETIFTFDVDFDPDEVERVTGKKIGVGKSNLSGIRDAKKYAKRELQSRMK